ncbi:MAG: ATP-grasp domain-containing protein [Ktedonobacteraceae bacterium]|nr:ATP-grasp domain-containing protein [Ktedonobacteraceae bacterium]
MPQQGTPIKAYDTLVLDAHLRQSLATVRSLGSRGLRVAALERAELAAHLPTFASRWCQEAFVAPSSEQGIEAYVQYLETRLRATPARVLITSSDGTLEILRQHRERLSRHAGLAIASESALDMAVQKERTLALARELQINVPIGVPIRTSSEVSEAVRTVGLPAVVKPTRSWIFGEQTGVRLNCQLAMTVDEARSAVEQVERLGGTSILQQFVPGRCESIHLFYARGEVYARFAQWAKRTQPPLGGTSVYRQSIAVPEDIGEQAERLVRAAQLEGYAEVEFRRSVAGTPYLMEINPRLSASVEVAVRAGVDFPHLLYQWANGDPIDRVKTYHVGMWMRYLQGDLLTTLQTITQRRRASVPPPSRAISGFLASFLVPAHYDYFDWRDLKPGLAATIDFGRVVARRLRRDFFSRRYL